MWTKYFTPLIYHLPHKLSTFSGPPPWRAKLSKMYLVPFKRKSIFRKLKTISVSLLIRNQLETGIILLVRTCSRIDYSLRTHMLARLTIPLAANVKYRALSWNTIQMKIKQTKAVDNKVIYVTTPLTLSTSPRVVPMLGVKRWSARWHGWVVARLPTTFLRGSVVCLNVL